LNDVEATSMDVRDLALTALRASMVYVFLLVVVRLLGKRTVGNFSAFDLIVALILGEIVDEPIFGDVPLVQAFVAIVVVAGWHYLNSYLTSRNTAIERLTSGEPRVLVKDGKPVKEAMAIEHVNEEELMSLLRLHEIDDLREIKRATLEPSGTLSVIKTEEAKELQKGDLAKVRKRSA
jgi:uncharacterized membrane protein YcaP (DUF421 family)